MTNNQDNKDLGSKQSDPKSRSYGLAKTIQSKNLLVAIRKETFAIKRVLRSWKYDNIKKLEQKLENETNQFTKLKENLVGERKKKKPVDDEAVRITRRKKTKKELEEEKKKKQEQEEKRKKQEQEKKDQNKKKPEEPKKPKPEPEAKKPTTPEIPKEKPKFKLPEIPKINIPKPNFGGLNLRNIAGKFLNLGERFSGITRIMNNDILGGGAQLLSTFGKFAKSKTLNFFDPIMQALRGDVVGGAISAGTQQVTSSLIGRALKLLPKTPLTTTVGRFGPYGMAIASGLIAGNELVKWRKEQDRKQKERIQKQIDALEKAKRGENKIVYPAEFKQGPRNWWEDITSKLSRPFWQTPQLAEGGVISKPTLAIIGEGGEKEYIVPESKLDKFVNSNSENDTLKKPARIILGVVSNFISQFGKGSSDIRRMVGSDILRLERIFGKERFTLPIFTKGEGNFDAAISAELNKILGRGGMSMSLKEAIDNLMYSLDYFVSSFGMGGKEGGMGPAGPTGPVPQGTNADFWTLVAIASLESGNPQGRADVAQSIYNRLVSGVYSGRTIKDLILAENQYQPVRESDVNLWRQIKDRETAIAAVASHKGKGIATATEFVDQTARSITDPQLQENARQFVGGRTDFAVPSAAAIQPGGIADKERYGHLFGWYVGSGAIGYGRTNPGPAPIPNFSGISTSQGSVSPSPSSSATTSSQMPSARPSGASGIFLENSAGQRVTDISQLSHHNGTNVGDGRKKYDVIFVTSSGSTDVNVPSPVSGRVAFAGWAGAGGNWVEIISNDGKKIELGHFKSLNVKEGDTVVQGSTNIGVQGTTGRSSGPHVHIQAPYEVISAWINGVVSGRYVATGSPSSSNASGLRSNLTSTRVNNIRRTIRQGPSYRFTPNQSRKFLSSNTNLNNSSMNSVVAIQPIIVQNTITEPSTNSTQPSSVPSYTSISGSLGSWVPNIA